MTADPNRRAKYEGMCHCGKVHFTVWIESPLIIEECNCSICSKTAYLHILIPRTNLRRLVGASHLESYAFGTNTATHLFCKTCGVKTFYVPRSHPRDYSVNARCLKDFEITTHKIEQFDGQNYESNVAALQKKVNFLEK